MEVGGVVWVVQEVDCMKADELLGAIPEENSQKKQWLFFKIKECLYNISLVSNLHSVSDACCGNIFYFTSARLICFKARRADMFMSSKLSIPSAAVNTQPRGKTIKALQSTVRGG